MKFLHTMVRVENVDASLNFYCNIMGMVEIKRHESQAGKFTLIFLAAPDDANQAKDTMAPLLELTYNWPVEGQANEQYSEGRNFGHLAFEVDDIYAACAKMQKSGVVINRPPRDGHMAFVRSPDNISIEILQKNGSLEIQEPWKSMPNTGKW